MINIESLNLNTAGSELLMDADSFLQDLTDTDAMTIQAGYGGKAKVHDLLEFGLGVYAINNVVSLAKSFSQYPRKPYDDAATDDAPATDGQK
jgi:hypothetical protein